MKTEYKKEVIELLNSMFITSTPEAKNSIPLSLDDIYEMVINVLPAKWIYKSDVYEALKELNFKIYHGKKENDKCFYYYVLEK